MEVYYTILRILPIPVNPMKTLDNAFPARKFNNLARSFES